MLSAYLLAVWAILLELAPWLLLGAAVAGALHVLMPRNFIRRHLGGRGAWTTLKAAVVGVPMPLCSCAVIPTGLGLRRDGAGKGAAVSFLISTPQTGVDSVAVTAAFLGWPFALFKLAAALVTGVAGGLLANLGESEEAPEPTGARAPPQVQRGGRLRAAWTFAVDDLLRMIWRWLVFGILVSAVITTLVDPGAIDVEGLGGGLVAMLVSLLISLPLYVCATASVPIAAALVHAGLPTGAALVFLMAGPATNIATIGAVGRVLGWRTAAIYLGTIIVGSVGLGLAYDAFIGLEAVDLVGHGHEHATWWATAAAVVLLALLLRFALGDLRRLLGGRTAADGEGAAATGCCAPQPEAVESTSGCCRPTGTEAPETVETGSGCCGSPAPSAPGPGRGKGCETGASRGAGGRSCCGD